MFHDKPPVVLSMQFILQKHPRNTVLTTNPVLKGVTHVVDLGLSVIALPRRQAPATEPGSTTFQSQTTGFAIYELWS